MTATPATTKKEFLKFYKFPTAKNFPLIVFETSKTMTNILTASHLISVSHILHTPDTREAKNGQKSQNVKMLGITGRKIKFATRIAKHA